MLLLVDDARSGEHVRPLLPGTAGNGVIVTSRQNIHLSGARLFEPRPFTTEETRLLLHRIVGGRRLAAEPEAADRIVRACEGFPMAVRIAGERIATRRARPLSSLADMLTSQAILNTLATREPAVRTAIIDAYHELDPEARHAFRYLSLAGEHDFPAWAASLLLREIGSEHLLEELRDRSLLLDAESDTTGRPRYRMPGLLRAFAQEVLRCDPEHPAALEQILTLWTEVADHAGTRIDPLPAIERPERLPPSHPVSRAITAEVVAPDAAGWLDREKGLLLGAVRLAVVGGLPAHALRLAVRLSGHLTLHHPEKAEAMWRSIVDAVDEPFRGEAHRGLAAVQAARAAFGKFVNRVVA